MGNRQKLIPDAPRDGSSYVRNNGAWVAGAGGGATQLSELSDVATSTATNRFVLAADGTDFHSRALVEADISDLGSYLSNVSEDASPQLGGALDVNGQTIDFADGELLRFGSSNDMTLSYDGTADRLDISDGVTRFDTSSNLFTAAPVEINGGAAAIKFIEDDAATDTQRWIWGVGSNVFRLRMFSDDESTNGDAIAVTRDSGANTASEIDLEAAAVKLGNYEFDADQTVGAGQDNYVLTYDNSDGQISLEAAGGGSFSAFPGVFSESGSQNLTTTEATVDLDTEDLDPDGNYSVSSGEITVTTGGYFHVDVCIPVNDDGSTGSTRCRIFSFIQRDQGSGTWINDSRTRPRGQDYARETSGGEGVMYGGIIQLDDGEAFRVRIDLSSAVDLSTESGETSVSIHRVSA